jgi:hypothetical protein
VAPFYTPIPSYPPANNNDRDLVQKIITVFITTTRRDPLLHVNHSPD